jgi:hypothetical protein
MERTERDGFQNEKVKGARKKVSLFSHSALLINLGEDILFLLICQGEETEERELREILRILELRLEISFPLADLRAQAIGRDFSPG